MTGYSCPVCWQTVKPTINDLIRHHFDTHNNYCPASHQPWRITLTNQREHAA